MNLFDLLVAEKLGGGIDTSDATATKWKIVNGYTAYVNGQKVTGSLTARSEVEYTFSAVNSFTAYNLMLLSSVANLNVLVAFCNGYLPYANSSNYICTIYGTNYGTENEKFLCVKTDGSIVDNVTGLLTYGGFLKFLNPADHGMTGVSYAGGNWTIVCIGTIT